MKQQLHPNYQFLKCTAFEERLVLVVVLCKGLNEIEDYESFKHVIPHVDTKKWSLTGWIEYCGTRYQRDMIITISGTKVQPCFGIIAYIVVSELHEAYFLYKQIKILKFMTY